MTEIQKIKLGGYVGEEVQKINDNFEALNGAIPTKTSELTNDSDFATAQDVANAVGEITVPTKTSELTNDSGFATTQDVANAVGAISVPTKTSELTNDSGFATAQDVANAVGEITVPTKTSELTNDSGFATTQDVANAVGAIPTKTSELTNDSNFVKSTDTAFINKVDKEEGKGLSEENYTTAEKNKLSGLSAPTEKAIITSDWTASNGQYVCTLAMSGKKPGVVMRKNGTEYGAVIVDVKISGSNVVITADEAFEGYIICI